MDLDSILRTAVQIEKDGIDFYAESAAKITDENGKATLESLAREEYRHKKFFEGILETQGAGRQNLLRALNTPRIFPKAKKFSGSDDTSVDFEILQLALEAEKKSIDLYAGALRQFKEKSLRMDDSLRRGLEIIINEELQHLEWIEFITKDLEKHGFWANLHEHFSLEG